MKKTVAGEIFVWSIRSFLQGRIRDGHLTFSPSATVAGGENVEQSPQKFGGPQPGAMTVLEANAHCHRRTLGPSSNCQQLT